MARRPRGRDEQVKAWAAQRPSGRRAEPAAKPPRRERNSTSAAEQPGAKKPKPSPEAMARAKAILSPPPAPWHPLPLAELAIALGFLAMLIAALFAKDDGILAGFGLIVLGTAEFTWREHRHGYRPHATVLALTIGFAVGAICWRFVGLTRDQCIGAGIVVFLIFWGSLDRAYVPAAQREARAAAAGAEDAGDARDPG